MKGVPLIAVSGRFLEDASRPFSLSGRNLQRLCLVRLMLILLEILTTSYVVVSAGVAVDHWTVGAIIAFQTLLVTVTQVRLKSSLPLTAKEWVLQLSVDILGLSLFLFFFGGSTNPLVTYLLLPVVIASALLPALHLWLVTLFAIIAYTFLMFYYRPIVDSIGSHGHGMHETGDNSLLIGSHLQGMWLTFVVTALLINTFVMKMARAIRQQKEVIAANRERQLRDEQILAVATHAAGTAHALGTPLTTMTLLIDEMKASGLADNRLGEDLEVLSSQVDTCKTRLRELVEHCSKASAYRPVVTGADVFLRQLVDQWQLLRPQVKPALSLPDGKAVQVLTDPSLAQAMINLLDNAADASPGSVEIDLQWNSETVLLQIMDRGGGITLAEAEAMGTLFFSTKKEGLGLGLSLSQATIERLNGKVRLYNREGGGTITEVELPIMKAVHG